MELGERTARMVKAKNQYDNAYDSEVTSTKGQQLADIGMNRKQASRYEQLIKPENRPIVAK